MGSCCYYARSGNFHFVTYMVLIMSSEKNIKWHPVSVTLEERQHLKHHKGGCIWFTGLSGSGKSTLANLVEKELNQKGFHTFLLDGDNVRHGLNSDLGFSIEDRQENIRRLGEVARLFADAGILVMTAFISPLKADRESARTTVSADRFVEIYVDCSLDVCEQRDPKNLYKKARNGEVKDFTGINSPYDIPEHPDIRVDNNNSDDLAVNVAKITEFVIKKFSLKTD